MSRVIGEKHHRSKMILSIFNSIQLDFILLNLKKYILVGNFFLRFNKYIQYEDLASTLINCSRENLF